MKEAVLRSDQLPYLRLRDLISEWILEGRIRNGDRLPSIRKLAAQMRLNTLTVGKAYHHLMETGVVEMRHGVGVFLVSGGFERLRQYERTRFLTEDWPTICRYMQRLQLDVPTLIAAIPA